MSGVTVGHGSSCDDRQCDRPAPAPQEPSRDGRARGIIYPLAAARPPETRSRGGVGPRGRLGSHGSASYIARWPAGADAALPAAHWRGRRGMSCNRASRAAGRRGSMGELPAADAAILSDADPGRMPSPAAGAGGG